MHALFCHPPSLLGLSLCGPWCPFHHACIFCNPPVALGHVMSHLSMSSVICLCHGSFVSMSGVICGSNMGYLCWYGSFVSISWANCVRVMVHLCPSGSFVSIWVICVYVVGHLCPYGSLVSMSWAICGQMGHLYPCHGPFVVFSLLNGESKAK